MTLNSFGLTQHYRSDEQRAPMEFKKTAGNVALVFGASGIVSVSGYVVNLFSADAIDSSFSPVGL